MYRTQFAAHRNVSHTICSTPQCIAHNVSHFTAKLKVRQHLETEIIDFGVGISSVRQSINKNINCVLKTRNSQITGVLISP
jgi:hypothetical protein